MKPRRPRVVWLIDSDHPTGAARMVLRRATVLRRRMTSTVLACRCSAKPPSGSSFESVQPLATVTGEIAAITADVWVTTSARTLSVALRKHRSHARIVHFVHQPIHDLLRQEEFITSASAVTQFVLPIDADRDLFAGAVGISADIVHCHDDFVLPSEQLLATGEGSHVIAVGRLRPEAGIVDLVRGYALARPNLGGGQLRIYGWGPERDAIRNTIAEAGVAGHALLMGPAYDLEAEYLDAGIAVRLNTADTAGLPVMEALSVGLPVLGAVTVPAVQRLLVDGENGMVLESVDPESIAEALAKMADPADRGHLAAGARSRPAGQLTEQGAASISRMSSRWHRRTSCEACRRAVRRPSAGKVNAKTLAAFAE